MKLEPGFYWIKEQSDCEWSIAETDGDRWSFLESEGGLCSNGEQPEIVGPKINEHKEELNQELFDQLEKFFEEMHKGYAGLSISGASEREYQWYRSGKFEEFKKIYDKSKDQREEGRD